jgi:hypothetical protein
MLKSIVYSGVPLAALVLLPRLIPVRVFVVNGDKKRGSDSFKAACTVKNTGDVDVTLSKVVLAAYNTSAARSITIATWTNIGLPKGATKRFPETDYASVTVPNDWPLGTSGCQATVDYNGLETIKKVEDAWNVVAYTVRLESVSPSKTTLNPGESYTLTIYYTVDQGTYSVILDYGEIDRFTTYGESGWRSYSLTAPSSPGTYTHTVTLQRLYTGEKDSKSYTITVVTPPPSGYLSNLRTSWNESAKTMSYYYTVNITQGTGTWKVITYGYFSITPVTFSVTSVPYSKDQEWLRETLSSYKSYSWKAELYSPDGVKRDEKWGTT